MFSNICSRDAFELSSSSRFCIVKVRRSSKFKKKFANLFLTIFAIKTRKKIFLAFKKIQIFETRKYFFFTFSSSKRFFLVSSKFFGKFGSVRCSTLEVRFDSSSTFESSDRFEFEKRWFVYISDMYLVCHKSSDEAGTKHFGGQKKKTWGNPEVCTVNIGKLHRSKPKKTTQPKSSNGMGPFCKCFCFLLLFRNVLRGQGRN